MKNRNIIGVFFLIICILVFLLYKYNSTNRNNELVQSYQTEVVKYLKEQYSEEFDVKFLKKGYKKKVKYLLDHSPIYYGKDKNIEEYLYEFSPKVNKEIVCYVAYWYNINTNKSEIKEIEHHHQIFNIFNARKVEKYSQIMLWYDHKLKVKDLLKDILPKDYDIDFNYYSSRLIIKIEENLREVALNNQNNFINFYDNILKLDQSGNVILKYKDYTIYFYKYYGELKGEKFERGQDIVEYFKQN